MTETEFFSQFENLRTYSYYTSVLDSVSDYLDEHKEFYREHDVYDVEDIIDCMTMDDSVTGNASGSFYCSRWKARCCLFGNDKFLDIALKELDYTDSEGNAVPNDEPEINDVIVRIYVLTINARDEVEELITKAYPWLLDEADSSEE